MAKAPLFPIRLDNRAREMLQEMAAAEGRSMADVIRWLIRTEYARRTGEREAADQRKAQSGG